MISHGILPILPAYFTKFVVSLVSTKKLSSILESPYFRRFSQNDANAKSGREMVMENEKNGK